MTSNGMNLVPPKGNPEAYCRMCFSSSRVKPFTPSGTVSDQELVQVVGKHLGIWLMDQDFPCGICQICEEKLEELHLCNSDGLLDEWQDEDLLEFKASCIAVDESIRQQRKKEPVKEAGDDAGKRVVLPFHKMNDGRYKCNVCPDEVFEFISSCIKHNQEVHATLGEISTEPVQNSAIRGQKQSFNCVSCEERFDNIDALIAHRETHQTAKRKADQLEEPVVDVDGGSVAAVPLAFVGGEMQFYQCVVCSALVDGVLSLLEHRMLHVLDASKLTADTWLGDSANVTITHGYKCPYCTEQFVDSKGYYFHLNFKHDKSTCDLCGEAVSSVSKLVIHQRSHRMNNVGTLACESCSITVFTQAELDDHSLHHQTLIPIDAQETAGVLPITDDCYFLDGQGTEECILSDDQGNLADDASTKVVEISDDED